MPHICYFLWIRKFYNQNFSHDPVTGQTNSHGCGKARTKNLRFMGEHFCFHCKPHCFFICSMLFWLLDSVQNFHYGSFFKYYFNFVWQTILLTNFIFYMCRKTINLCSGKMNDSFEVMASLDWNLDKGSDQILIFGQFETVLCSTWGRQIVQASKLLSWRKFTTFITVD